MIKKSLNLVFSGEKFKALLKRYKVKRIAIFGSYTSGTARKRSDVDFLVEFTSEADLFDQIGLKQGLEVLLKNAVDVVTPRSLNPYIRDKVLREAVYL